MIVAIATIVQKFDCDDPDDPDDPWFPHDCRDHSNYLSFCG